MTRTPKPDRAPESPDLDGIATHRLGAIEQRYTSQRRALVTALRDAGRPVSIADLLGADGSFVQSSLYRNLVVLEQAGLVIRVMAQDDFVRYELSEDLVDHHHHLICTTCSRIDDFAISIDDEHELLKALERRAKRAGFVVSGHRLDLVGTCANCNAANL